MHNIGVKIKNNLLLKSGIYLTFFYAMTTFFEGLIDDISIMMF